MAAGDSGRDEDQIFEQWNLRHSERSERGGKNSGPVAFGTIIVLM